MLVNLLESGAERLRARLSQWGAMKVKARFLTLPPGAALERELVVDIPPGTTAGGLVLILARQYPVLRSFTRFVSVVVNRAYVGLQAELHDGDEVVYSPPVGGG